MNEDLGRALLEIVRQYNAGFDPARRDYAAEIANEARQAVEQLIREGSDSADFVSTAQNVLQFIRAGKRVPAP